MTGDKKFMKGVGNRLRFARDEAGMSTEDLAGRMGLAPLTVARHLRGETSPSLRTLIAYARVLDTQVDALLPRLDSNQQPAGYRSVAA